MSKPNDPHESGPILIVEDNRPIGRLLTQTLADEGWTSVLTGSVNGAMQELEAGHRFVLLVLDVTLPDGNGLELAGRVAEMRPEMPVLLMSGYDLSGAAHPYIRKPFETEEFVGKVRELMRTD